jgi:hypothetical protein
VLLGGDPPPLETQRAKEKDDAEKDGRDSDNSDREDTVQSVLNTIQAHHALLEHHCNAPKWPIEEMKRLGLN